MILMSTIQENLRCYCGGVLLCPPDQDALRCDVGGHTYDALLLNRWDLDGTLAFHARTDGRLPWPRPVVAFLALHTSEPEMPSETSSGYARGHVTWTSVQDDPSHEDYRPRG